jgi:hypothetical protein
VGGCTTGSGGEVPGERKPVIRNDDNDGGGGGDDDDDDNNNNNNNNNKCFAINEQRVAPKSLFPFELVKCKTDQMP